jgi:hypothetical protein
LLVNRFLWWRKFNCEKGNEEKLLEKLFADGRIFFFFLSNQGF